MKDLDPIFIDGIMFTLMETGDLQFANSLLKKKIMSKQWLCDKVLLHHGQPKHTLILGAWYPTLIPYVLGGKYTFVDKDPDVIESTKIFNKRVYKSDEMDYNIIDAYDYLSICNQRRFDLIINTSCEHMFDMSTFVVDGPLYALQSNNYFGIDGHINCKNNLTEFVESTGLSSLFYTGTLTTEKYERYMVIGRL